jgi:hypothetical protein
VNAETSQPEPENSGGKREAQSSERLANIALLRSIRDDAAASRSERINAVRQLEAITGQSEAVDLNLGRMSRAEIEGELRRIQALMRT